MKTRNNIGLGTRKLHGESGIFAIKEALRLGFRTFDLAWIYHNSEIFAQALKETQIARSELFITSKVWFDYVPDYGKHQFVRSDFFYSLWDERFRVYLDSLGLDYVDEMLLHWPTWQENDLEMLKKLAFYQEKGVVKQIGVANFPVRYLKALRNQLPCSLSCNQIEFHPCLFDQKMLDFSKEKNLTLVGYSPLGHGKILKNPSLEAIAKKHGKSVAQVCLAWCLQKGISIVVKASSSDHLQEILSAESFCLDDEDLCNIEQLPKHYRYCNPPFAPRWD